MKEGYSVKLKSALIGVDAVVAISPLDMGGTWSADGSSDAVTGENPSTYLGDLYRLGPLELFRHQLPDSAGPRPTADGTVASLAAEEHNRRPI